MVYVQIVSILRNIRPLTVVRTREAEAKGNNPTSISHSRPTREQERTVTVLGSSGVENCEARIQKVTSTGRMEVMSDGRSITRNEAGEIIKTCDAMKSKREYAHDPESGELLVKRFGLWTKPEFARLDESGTLYFQRGNVEVEEHLNGLHVLTNRTTGVQIQTNHHSRFEIVRLANGEVWKRTNTDEKETFGMWANDKLTFKSETYTKPKNSSCETPSGLQSLSHVSRWEQSWENGFLTREKHTFVNAASGIRQAAIFIELGTGMLNLKQVTSVLTIFEDGKPQQTTYELKEATKLKIDIPNRRCELADIVRVRIFPQGPNIGIAFDTSDDNEYLVFSGSRGHQNRARAAKAANVIETAFENNEEPAADLVLR